MNVAPLPCPCPRGSPLTRCLYFQIDIRPADPVHVRDLVLPDNAPPRGVAASPSHIAVSSWLENCSGDHVVCLLDAATGEPIRVFGDVTPEPTVAAPGRLVRPAGVRFSADGTQVRL